MKELACVLASTPYGQRTIRDALDIVMASAAFDIPPALFFIDDGVFALLKAQSPEGIEQKNLASMLQSLPLFDVSDINVCQLSLDKRMIGCDDLILSPEPFQREHLWAVLNEFRIVLTF